MEAPTGFVDWVGKYLSRLPHLEFQYPWKIVAGAGEAGDDVCEMTESIEPGCLLGVPSPGIRSKSHRCDL